MRVKGWEKALLAVLRRHAQEPFAYGLSDCFTLPMDAVLAVTGKDPCAALRRYKTEQGAGKVLKTEGFKDVADLFAAYFEEIPPAFAGRGDIGAVISAEKLCGVVVAGHDLIGKTEEGAVYFPRVSLARAFKVA